MNMPGDMRVIVPVRGIARGKSRLSPVLDENIRAQLNRWMLARTLRTVTRWLPDPALGVVVSACRETRDIAAATGMSVLIEPAESGGLNYASIFAIKDTVARGAKRVLILPCDLPWLNHHALDAMAQLAALQTMVIAPDRHGTGTNALLIDATVARLNFGARSYARHLAWAAAHGRQAAVCSRPELRFDLDTPEDLAFWSRSGVAMPDFLSAVVPQT